MEALSKYPLRAIDRAELSLAAVETLVITLPLSVVSAECSVHLTGQWQLLLPFLPYLLISRGHGQGRALPPQAASAILSASLALSMPQIEPNYCVEFFCNFLGRREQSPRSDRLSIDYDCASANKYMFTLRSP